MSESTENSQFSIIYRRWAYMLIAILASAVLFVKPVFTFQSDKGILYVRSFSMDQQTFYVTQTSLSDGVAEITDTMSVKWLYYLNKVMLWGSILCFLCFFHSKVRILLTYLVAGSAGAYYVMMMYYALQISDLHYATLSPNYMAILPAIICYCMIMTGRNVIQDTVAQADEERDHYEAE